VKRFEVVPVTEPSTAVLVLIAGGALFWLRTRKRRPEAAFT
jgi:hypothetical protein